MSFRWLTNKCNAIAYFNSIVSVLNDEDLYIFRYVFMFVPFSMRWKYIERQMPVFIVQRMWFLRQFVFAQCKAQMAHRMSYSQSYDSIASWAKVYKTAANVENFIRRGTRCVSMERCRWLIALNQWNFHMHICLGCLLIFGKLPSLKFFSFLIFAFVLSLSVCVYVLILLLIKYSSAIRHARLLPGKCTYNTQTHIHQTLRIMKGVRLPLMLDQRQTKVHFVAVTINITSFATLFTIHASSFSIYWPLSKWLHSNERFAQVPMRFQ